MDEIREMQRQNNRLSDSVAEMKKELKELKGEAFPNNLFILFKNNTKKFTIFLLRLTIILWTD
jgi:hypothetical protein